MGASVLATIYGGINFIPKKRTIQILRAKFGPALDKILYDNGIAESAERLSEHQAKYLISKWKDAHSLRRGILNLREKEGQRIFSESGLKFSRNQEIKFQRRPISSPITKTDKYPQLTTDGKSLYLFSYDDDDKKRPHAEPLPFMYEHGFETSVI